MAAEKYFENKIKGWLKEHDCYFVKFFANRMTKSGVPDILACVNGYFVGIEVKAQNGRPSELQMHNVKKIREAGGFAYVVYPSGWDKLKEILEGLLKGYYSVEESEVLK
jgi:Holliday junction resolvase